MGIKLHEGFSLRMPAHEVPEWVMENDKGVTVDINRPAFAARVWNAESRSYDAIDVTLDGAPRSLVRTQQELT
jgi:hypothetical protein